MLRLRLKHQKLRNALEKIQALPYGQTVEARNIASVALARDDGRAEKAVNWLIAKLESMPS